MSLREKSESFIKEEIARAVIPELWVRLVADPKQIGLIIAVNHEQKESLFIQWNDHAAWHAGDEVEKYSP